MVEQVQGPSPLRDWPPFLPRQITSWWNYSHPRWAGGSAGQSSPTVASSATAGLSVVSQRISSCVKVVTVALWLLGTKRYLTDAISTLEGLRVQEPTGGHVAHLNVTRQRSPVCRLQSFL